MSPVKDRCSVVSSLVPMYCTGNRTEERENPGEQQMCAVALLIAETVLGTLKALDQKNYKAFDANPADGACQSQALELRRVVALDLSEESRQLEKGVRDLKRRVQARKSNSKERKNSSPEAFFSTHVESIAISKEMEYLLHCFLLTVTRVAYKRLENGVILTQTDPGRLTILSKKLSNVKVIASEAQARLSMLNMEAIRRHAQAELAIEMLSKENTHIYTPDPRYPPKAYGSLFYSVQTVLHRLREERALIALKSIVKEGRPFFLPMIPSCSGGRFELLPESTYPDLAHDIPIVVFEAVVEGSREAAIEEIRGRGFTDLALTSASKEAPFEPSSDLSSINIPKALLEIRGYREKRSSVQFDHVYLTTVGKEGEGNVSA
ncbi:MAG: hypothetical protein JJU12_06975 [Chlamydiales bacterium]|nr:hypothetical protein [Chlamydiales bacterium]